ncbi:TPA: DUF2345 domain-containing protein, partial [Klebsiella pneumoniae]|nr:DUF2345 domain-containing protein [Klebsiella pneumoniae]
NVDAIRKLRGEGFELRTDSWGGIRAGKGIFITADSQPEAQGKVLDMAAVHSLLTQAVSQMESLSQAASAAKAQLLQYEQQQALMEEKLLALKQAVLLMSAPEGIALASGSHLQAVASENIYMTAGQNVELGAKKNITLAASEKISIFTETEGVEAIVAKGDIISQAQSGNIEVIAKQNISLTSTTKDMTFTAAKTLTFTCVGGAYIRLSGGNIELGCPGDIMMKQSKLLYSGPASMQSNIPELPDSGPQSMSFMLLDALGNAAPSTMKVSLFDSESKEQIWNSAFNDGESGCFEQPESKNFHAIIGDDKWTSLFSYNDEHDIEDETDDDLDFDEHGPQYDGELNEQDKE